MYYRIGAPEHPRCTIESGQLNTLDVHVLLEYGHLNTLDVQIRLGAHKHTRCTINIMVLLFFSLYRPYISIHYTCISVHYFKSYSEIDITLKT